MFRFLSDPEPTGNLTLTRRKSRLWRQPGATVAVLATELPSKASLLLAPALRERIEDVIGWPVLAVAPDRDFVYVWNASRRDLITGLGGVVTREHARAPYPPSTEIFQIGDSLRAIGA